MNEPLVSPLIVYLIFNIKLFTLIMLLIGVKNSSNNITQNYTTILHTITVRNIF